ncbi:MAG: epimerase, partial [bacterium]|nr:epimerase [bacterium]
RIIGRERPIVSVPDWVGYCVGRAVGVMVGDIMITREEIGGLKADLLYTDSPPAGSTRLTEWAEENASVLGTHYASEMARRRNRTASYDAL